MIFRTRMTKNQEPSPYATKRDFCQIFEKNMSPLYLLSILLTGDQATAEQCFVGGLHIAQEGNLVFREWAESWARRTIILNAIRMMRPRWTSESVAVPESGRAGHQAIEQPEVNAIVGLPVFERFAFVMSVLEGYADHECAIHLNCTTGEIRDARTRALGRLGKSAEPHAKFVTIASHRNTPTENSQSGFPFETASRLAVPA